MYMRVIANLYAVSYTNKTHILFIKYIFMIYLDILGKEEPPCPKSVLGAILLL